MLCIHLPPGTFCNSRVLLSPCFLRMPTKGVPSADFSNSDVNVEGYARDVFAEVGRGEDVFDERRHERWHRRIAQPVQEGDV